MDMTEITALYDRVHKAGYGSVQPDEIDFIQSLITRHSPRRFIEIGMASGLSTGFIARFLEAQGGGTLVSLDHDNTFFGDPEKPNGFLFDTIYQGDKVDAALTPFKTAVDIAEFPGGFDMAFVDANHQHPWPALNMLALYPQMTGARIMIHHDLRLYATQTAPRGIGPKYLFDQFPESHRIRSQANGGNIFAVDLNMAQDQFEALLSDLIRLPWTLETEIHDEVIARFEHLIRDSYSPAFLDHFRKCCALYNTPAQASEGTAQLIRQIGQLQKRVEMLHYKSDRRDSKLAQLENKVEHTREMVRLGMGRRILNRIKGQG